MHNSFGGRGLALASVLASLCMTIAACGDDSGAHASDAGDAGSLLDSGRDDASVAGSGGSSGSAGSAGSAGTGSADAAVEQDAAVPLTEGQVAQILKSVNEGEIELGELAVTNAASVDVLSFAQLMVQDHTASNEMLQTVLIASAIAPAPSKISLALQAEEQRADKKLKTLVSTEFDASYIKGQLTLHTELVALIKNEFLSTVSDTKLRTLLVATRNSEQTHLLMIKSLADELTGDASL